MDACAFDFLRGGLLWELRLVDTLKGTQKIHFVTPLKTRLRIWDVFLLLFFSLDGYHLTRTRERPVETKKEEKARMFFRNLKVFRPEN